KLLQFFFSLAPNPAQLNYQGPDRGTQYRSSIFVANDEQKRVAQSYIAQLDKSGLLSGPIVTTIETGKTFYPAEDYHQDFMTRNPTYPYRSEDHTSELQSREKLVCRLLLEKKNQQERPQRE